MSDPDWIAKQKWDERILWRLNLLGAGAMLAVAILYAIEGDPYVVNAFIATMIFLYMTFTIKEHCGE